jgi:hypothetical protein
MVGHPACLGADTQVLTERHGWISIIDVEQTDRVFDGEEFVVHHGCSYSGHKDVIDVMGVTMTPNHKLLIEGRWVEARNVQDFEEVREKARHLQGQIDDACRSGMFDLWGNYGLSLAKCYQEQQGRPGAMCEVPTDYFSSTYQYSNLANLAGVKVANQRPFRQKLWRAWDNTLSRVAGLQKILQRYVRGVFGRSDHRTEGCEWPLLQRQLPVGAQHGTTVEQTQQPICFLPGGAGTFSRIGEAFGGKQDDVDDATQPWDDRGSGSGGVKKFKIRKESGSGDDKTSRKAHVYDLVDCGPRHRFVIRNSHGEVFISHNSMGHGVDGLQDAGHTLVWFGLNWSLDLYEQFNARIRRQGQGVPVICHRILTLDTLDQAQALALNDKATTQNSLRNAIKSYRNLKESS